METCLKIKMQIEPVCENGFKIKAEDGWYAVHYGETLAFLPFHSMRDETKNIFLNEKFAQSGKFSQTDLKCIRALDESFKKKGEKFVSDTFEIKVAQFI